MKNKMLTVLSFALILAVWKILTFFFSPFVVPTIGSVAECLCKILAGARLRRMIGVTLVRLVCGLGIGVVSGLAVGMLMGHSDTAKGLLMPVISLMQTIPPVSWVVLALVWFGFNGKPAIFIVFTATLPIIALNISEGIRNVDRRLLEMADVFGFSAKKKYFNVVFPSILSYFKSAFRIALGSGWKIAVMGEVLTTSDGIGGMIKLARLNVEPENIIAWSIVVVILFYLTEIATHLLLFGKEKKHAADRKHQSQLRRTSGA